MRDLAGGHHSVSAPPLSLRPLPVPTTEWQCPDSFRDPHPPGTPAQPPEGRPRRTWGCSSSSQGDPPGPGLETRVRGHFLSFSPHPGNKSERAGLLQEAQFETREALVALCVCPLPCALGRLRAGPCPGLWARRAGLFWKDPSLWSWELKRRQQVVSACATRCWLSGISAQVLAGLE